MSRFSVFVTIHDQRSDLGKTTHVPTLGGLPHRRTSMEAHVTNKMEENARVTRRQRFVRLANKRVVKAIEAIQLLGNLSSPAYQYLTSMTSPKSLKRSRPRLIKRVQSSRTVRNAA
jgi:hypothetical protein